MSPTEQAGLNVETYNHTATGNRGLGAKLFELVI